MEKGKVDIRLIKRYLRGELSPREMYALERRAQDDPMLMDTILGMELKAQGIHETNLVDIRKRIAARTQKRHTRRLAPYQRWAVAASVLVALTFGTLWFKQEQVQTNLALAPTEAETLRSGPPATSAFSDQVGSEDATAEQLPQPKVPAAKAPASQRKKRVAAATPPVHQRAEDTANAIGITDRLAAGKQRRPMDTLDEVAAAGYGTQKKMALTGAVAEPEPSRENAVVNIAANEIDTPVKVTEQALAAHTPGIRIRGVSRKVNPTIFSGRILDGQTQQPLPGVALQLANGHTVTSDSSGRFVIADPGLIPSASFVGYELQSVKVVGKDTVLLIMKPSEVSLSEVVVVGYGQDNKTSKPEPKNGWRAYRRYLKDERRQAEGQEGTVHVTFTVDKDGRPTDIKIARTTNESLNLAAITIVLNGPDWKPGRDGERAVELQLTF